jgi:hypothetical protein
MAAMTTGLTQRNDRDNSRTYTVDGHTVQKPLLLTQKRVEGQIGGPSAKDTFVITQGVEDSDGAVLASKGYVEIIHRRPIEEISADSAARLALVLDLVNSDEFAAVWTSQNYLE